MKALLLLSLPTLLLAPAETPSAPRGENHPAKIMQLDKNGDQRISASEAEGTRLAERFTKLDKNEDGSLTQDELAQARRGRGGHGHSPAKFFAKLDRNGDGTIHKAEVEGRRLAEHFDKIDADKNGALTAAEFQAAHAKFSTEHRSHGRRNPAAWFAKADTNGDGKLTAQEVEGKPIASRFATLDRNGDGALTQEELKAAHGKRKSSAKGTGRHRGGPGADTTAKRRGKGPAPQGGSPQTSI